MSVVVPIAAFPQPIAPLVAPSTRAASTSSHLPPQVLELYVKAATAVAQALINAKDELNALDGATGDGDCGVTLQRGGQQVRQTTGVGCGGESCPSTRAPQL